MRNGYFVAAYFEIRFVKSFPKKFVNTFFISPLSVSFGLGRPESIISCVLVIFIILTLL